MCERPNKKVFEYRGEPVRQDQVCWRHRRRRGENGGLAEFEQARGARLESGGQQENCKKSALELVHGDRKA